MQNKDLIEQSLNDFNKIGEVDDVNEIWSIEDETDMVIAMHDYLSRKCSYGDNMNLSHEEMTFYLCQAFEGEINNGGFDQFYFNSSGDFAHETVLALKEIQANRAAEILEKTMPIFPDSKVPKDREVREDMLDLIQEDEKAQEILQQADNDFYEYEEDLTELSYVYLIQNKDKFI